MACKESTAVYKLKHITVKTNTGLFCDTHFRFLYHQITVLKHTSLYKIIAFSQCHKHWNKTEQQQTDILSTCVHTHTHYTHTNTRMCGARMRTHLHTCMHYWQHTQTRVLGGGGGGRRTYMHTHTHKCARVHPSSRAHTPTTRMMMIHFANIHIFKQTCLVSPSLSVRTSIRPLNIALSIVSCLISVLMVV